MYCAAAAHNYVTRKGHKDMWHAELHEAHVWPSFYKLDIVLWEDFFFLKSQLQSI